jgi:histidyl-tRNA synthetase
MISEVFEDLKITDYTIKINNRKLLAGITQVIGESGKEADFCVAIDKLDKIGPENVLKELSQRQFSEEALNKLSPILALKGSNNSKLDDLKTLLQSSESGVQGIKELEEVFEYLNLLMEDSSKVELDITLARGLSYYTGAIFEVKANNVQIGSVCGGGRYDNLTGVFGLPGVSGVGISFGVDRIYDVMESLDIFPESKGETTKVLFFNLDAESMKYSLGILNQLRKNNISSEIYPDSVKIKKQFQYADKKSIPYVVIIGQEEISSGKFTLKNLNTGEQQQLTVVELVKSLAK